MPFLGGGLHIFKSTTREKGFLGGELSKLKLTTRTEAFVGGVVPRLKQTNRAVRFHNGINVSLTKTSHEVGGLWVRLDLERDGKLHVRARPNTLSTQINVKGTAQVLSITETLR